MEQWLRNIFNNVLLNDIQRYDYIDVIKIK